MKPSEADVIRAQIRHQLSVLMGHEASERTAKQYAERCRTRIAELRAELAKEQSRGASTERFPQMATEFPDFDQATLPEIPANWSKSSWHNDTCPSFAIREYRDGEPYAQVYIDFADEAERESARGARFALVVTDAEGFNVESASFETDDWPAMLAHIEQAGFPTDDWAAILAHIAKENDAEK